MIEFHVRAKQGVKLLMGRQVFLQFLTFGGGVILARILNPTHFGLYVIATSLVTTFAMFGDFGLAPSFIQRKKELTDHDLRVGFTLQQIITTVVVVGLFAAAPALTRLYPKAPPETVWLVRTLAFNLYLTSWRTMSALQMERQMRYDRLAWIEVIETLSYQSLTVGLAIAGYGVWSFVWATLARGVLGTLLVFLASPWRVRLAFDGEIAREILRFGIPFQLQNIATQACGWIIPFLVGTLIGPQAVGYLMWATSNGRKPLVLVDNMIRVAFPHFSRIQDDRAEVERTLTRYLTFSLIASTLWFAVIAVAGEPLVTWIYTDKWAPASTALKIAAALLSFDIISCFVTVTLNSLNLVRFGTRILVLRAFVYNALSIPLVLVMGFNGVALGYLLGCILIVPCLFQGLGSGALKRVLGPTAWILVPTTVSTGIGWLALQVRLPVGAHAILLVAVTTFVYLAAAWLCAPLWLTAGLRSNLHRPRFAAAGTAKPPLG